MDETFIPSPKVVEVKFTPIDEEHKEKKDDK